MMLSIIWNVTNACVWDCSFCCMDAGPCSKRVEMSFREKLQVADGLKDIDCRVDLSGGEPMLNKEEHLLLLQRLSKNIGAARVGMSCSGAFIDDAAAERLSGILSEVEMTMDAHPDRSFCFRPKGYHKTAAQSAARLKKYGVTVGLQTVVTKAHQSKGILEELYAWLCDAGIDRWSILKFFPSGRGVNYPYLELTDTECQRIVERICTLDARNFSAAKPRIDFHYLMPGSGKDDRCRCVKKSVGILPDGRITSCFWGLNTDGRLLDNRFLLGDITKQSMTEILSGENALFWKNYCGRCYLENNTFGEAAL